MSFGVTLSGPGMDTSLTSAYEASSCANDDNVFYSWHCASYRAKSVMRRQAATTSVLGHMALSPVAADVLLPIVVYLAPGITTKRTESNCLGKPHFINYITHCATSEAGACMVDNSHH